MDTKLHAVTDTHGRPIWLFMPAGQVSDYTGATALLGGLPAAQSLIEVKMLAGFKKTRRTRG